MPPSLIGTVSHINRLRNYAAHHLNASDFEQKIEEFFRERAAFQIQWPHDGTHKAKCLLWAYALRGIATVMVAAAQALRMFREAQLDGTHEASGYDEPKCLREIGEGIVDQLSVPPFRVWIEIFEERAARARSSADPAGDKPSLRE